MRHPCLPSACLPAVVQVPAILMAKTGDDKLVAFEEWAWPCHLEAKFLEKRVMKYDSTQFDFVGATEAILKHSPLSDLHNAPIIAVEETETAPALRRAQVQAQVGGRITKEERKLARSRAWRFDRSTEWRTFMDVYQRFITDWVVPQFGVPLLYQRKPILRCVLPGSVAPTQLHCDADYFHDSNEVNFWVPLTHCSGATSLWSESAPGLGDYADFVAGPGEAVRFYGNRCRHYTIPNNSDRVRVSFDFRVIPQPLFKPPSLLASTLSKHALDPGSSKNGYYALAEPAGDRQEITSASSLGELRRSWRETPRRAPP